MGESIHSTPTLVNPILQLFEEQLKFQLSER